MKRVLPAIICLLLFVLLGGWFLLHEYNRHLASHSKKTGSASSEACHDDLRDVFFSCTTNAPRIGIAIGNCNTILRTIDNGKTWNRVFTRDPKGTEWIGGLFQRGKEAWVVSRSMLLHSTNGGEAWTTASQLPGNFYYYGPFAATRSFYYQMQTPTCGNAVWKTEDGGLSWTKAGKGLPRNDYQAVFFYDELHGWAGGNFGHLAITDDGGATWETHNIPNGGNLKQIQFVTPLQGWARPYTAHAGGIWATKDGGETWHKQSAIIETYHPILDMQFLDEAVGFLLVEAGGDASKILRTTDGGETWALLVSYPPGAEAICFLSPGEGWAVGRKGSIYHYRE
jgi:photosystem II stability/assembly factor-like uncharacterized protein